MKAQRGSLTLTVTSLEIWSNILDLDPVSGNHTLGVNNLKLAPILGVLRFLAQGDIGDLEHSRGNKSKSNKETKGYECQTESEWMRAAASYPRTGGYQGQRAPKAVHRFPG